MRGSGDAADNPLGNNDIRRVSARPQKAAGGFERQAQGHRQCSRLVYLELPLPIEFKRPPSTGKITFVM